MEVLSELLIKEKSILNEIEKIQKQIDDAKFKLQRYSTYKCTRLAMQLSYKKLHNKQIENLTIQMERFNVSSAYPNYREDFVSHLTKIINDLDKDVTNVHVLLEEHKMMYIDKINDDGSWKSELFDKHYNTILSYLTEVEEKELQSRDDTQPKPRSYNATQPQQPLHVVDNELYAHQLKIIHTDIYNILNFTPLLLKN